MKYATNEVIVGIDSKTTRFALPSHVTLSEYADELIKNFSTVKTIIENMPRIKYSSKV